MQRANSIVERLLRGLVDPVNSGPLLAMAVMIYYGLLAILDDDFAGMPESRLVAGLAMVAGVSILLGWAAISRLAPADRLPGASIARLLLAIAVLAFGAFVAVTALTAPTLPLVSALAGQDPADIALAREQFLKAREGAMLALVYLNAALTFTLVPYAMCLGFIRKERTTWLLLVLFLGYSVLFLEKAFFIRVLAPLAALIVVTRNRRIKLSWLMFAALVLLLVNIALSGFADERGTLGFLFYRVFDIPVRTAIDTLAFWRDTWDGEHLLGATNLVLSQLFSLERIHLERLVFEYQFGPYESGTASANAVFFVDAFVNFGWSGVILTAGAVGALLAHVARSNDLAVRCLAPLIMYSAFSSSLYPMLFGNGLLAFLVVRYLWAGLRPSSGGAGTMPAGHAPPRRGGLNLRSVVIPLLIVSCMLVGGAAVAKEVEVARTPLPDSVALDIALRTLPPSETPFTGTAQERATEVRAFVEGMGGELWYGGYLKQFGRPPIVDDYKVADLSNLSAARLRQYYLLSRPVSLNALTALSCNTPEPGNRTSWGFSALCQWDSMLAFGDDNSRKQFLVLADRLLSEQKNGRWEWESDLPSRNLKSPWISGLTQSLGISVLLRAYQLVGESAYLAAASAAFRWLATPVSEGGVAATVDAGRWLEEYPDPAAPSHVLNGHMWALFGIWDYYRVTGSPDARELFESGVRALERNIHRYDVGGWSVYSRENQVDYVSGAYQQFIIEQLRVLENISGSKVLASYRMLWECALDEDALFVHLAAEAYSKANRKRVARRDYPRRCEEQGRAVLAIEHPIDPAAAAVLRRTPRAVLQRAAGNSTVRQAQVDKVAEWLPSVGGNQWFANYAAQFGRPLTRCVFEFSNDDVRTTRLGRYYLGHPVRRGRPTVEPECLLNLTGSYGIADRNTTTMVAHLALANWDAFATTGDPGYREGFLKHVSTLRDRQVDGRWEWLIEVPSRDLKAPWISAMTQSLGISVFLRAYQFTGEPDYLSRAHAAMKWIGMPLADGGTAFPVAVGTWYEEYPNAVRPSHVLNGHIWALFGIWDLYRVTGDRNALRMFEEGVLALKAEIERYDLGYWIVYDQLNRVDVVNGFYVSFIVEQLKALFAITGDRQFQRLARKWSGYLDDHSLFAHMAYFEFEKAQRAGR